MGFEKARSEPPKQSTRFIDDTPLSNHGEEEEGVIEVEEQLVIASPSSSPPSLPSSCPPPRRTTKGHFPSPASQRRNTSFLKLENLEEELAFEKNEESGCGAADLFSPFGLADLLRDLESDKWKKRMDQLDQLTTICSSVPKLQGNPDHITKLVRKTIEVSPQLQSQPQPNPKLFQLMDDNKHVVEISVIKLLGALGKSLGRDFDTHAHRVVSLLLDMFKESKVVVVKAVHDTLANINHGGCCMLPMAIGCIDTALHHKVGGSFPFWSPTFLFPLPSFPKVSRVRVVIFLVKELIIKKKYIGKNQTNIGKNQTWK